MRTAHAARLALLAAAALLGMAAWVDRGSSERANRLYRAGEVDGAAAVFRSASAARPERSDLAYNAGTAELVLGNAEAREGLAAAAAAGDSAVAERALYNLGYLYLTEVRGDLDPDSAITLVESAIESTRAALRLDATREDSRWNLALAQLWLDSIAQVRLPPDSRSDAGDDETPIDLGSLSRGLGEARSGIEPEDARASEVLGQRLAAAQGAREAWASQDPGPVSPETARRILVDVRHDPEQLIRGLLWSHRPDVAWWNSEPYPGGNW